MVGVAGGTFIIFFWDAAHDEMQQALVPDIIIFILRFSQLFRLSTFPHFIFQNNTYGHGVQFCVVRNTLCGDPFTGFVLEVEICSDQSELKFKSKTVGKLGDLHFNCWWIWSVSSLC